MRELNRIKELAGITESSTIGPGARAAKQAYHWVDSDISIAEMYAATWALFMEFDPNELRRLHVEFKNNLNRDLTDEATDPMEYDDDRPVYTNTKTGKETRHLPTELLDIYPPRGDVEMDTSAPTTSIRPRSRPLAPTTSIRPRARK